MVQHGKGGHPEVGLDHMGAPHFQLACSFPILGHLMALIIRYAHVCEEVWPALVHPVPQLFFFVQLPLAALHMQ